MAYQSINPFTNRKLKDYPSHSDQDIQHALDTAETNPKVRLVTTGRYPY